MPGVRITRQNLLGLGRKPVEATPHVRHASRKPDLCIRQHRDHAEQGSCCKPARQFQHKARINAGAHAQLAPVLRRDLNLR